MNESGHSGRWGTLVDLVRLAREGVRGEGLGAGNVSLCVLLRRRETKVLREGRGRHLHAVVALCEMVHDSTETGEEAKGLDSM